MFEDVSDTFSFSLNRKHHPHICFQDALLQHPTNFSLSHTQVMSAGRSADGREVQIPLQQVAPSLTTPLSVAPPIIPPSHRQVNPWPPNDSTASQGKHWRPPLASDLLCDSLRGVFIDWLQNQSAASSAECVRFLISMRYCCDQTVESE